MKITSVHALHMNILERLEIKESFKENAVYYAVLSQNQGVSNFI